MKQRIGVIGTGTMGQPMASNLSRAGYPVTAYDVREEPLRALGRLGVPRATSPAEVAAASDILIIMVMDAPQVRDVLLGPNGALGSLLRGAIVLCMSTIGPEAVRALEAPLAGAGVTLLDAPVTGGVEGAIAGTLTIMVAGPETAARAVRPVLDVLGGKIVSVGPRIGQGQEVKMLVQHLFFVGLAAAIEALILGMEAGVDLRAAWEVLRSGAGCSWIVEHRVPLVLDGRARFGDARPVLQKDLVGIVLEAGRALGLPLEMASAAARVLQRVPSGDTAPARLFREMLGVPNRPSSSGQEGDGRSVERG